ncbi:hypothetical protein NPIL_255601 [Nephila pilipes]|uniref:Uncharacterized protein n=1 Tax=Nephila pilipes TaxID=299642 RepID=A0A8X6UDN3_NEPPI|nr:hypothetical protein NPIL_255601 [Nephila pilipes]
MVHADITEQVRRKSQEEMDHPSQHDSLQDGEGGVAFLSEELLRRLHKNPRTILNCPSRKLVSSRYQNTMFFSLYFQNLNLYFVLQLNTALLLPNCI